MLLPPLIPFNKFKTISHISRMSLKEQIVQYDLYICETIMVYNMECAHRGASKTQNIEFTGFLQQEDLFYILQEDGFKIYVT